MLLRSVAMALGFFERKSLRAGYDFHIISYKEIDVITSTMSAWFNVFTSSSAELTLSAREVGVEDDQVYVRMRKWWKLFSRLLFPPTEVEALLFKQAS